MVLVLLDHEESGGEHGGDDGRVVLDGGFGVFGFVGVLVSDLGQAGSSEVDPVVDVVPETSRCIEPLVEIVSLLGYVIIQAHLIFILFYIIHIIFKRIFKFIYLFMIYV